MLARPKTHSPAGQKQKSLRDWESNGKLDQRTTCKLKLSPCADRLKNLLALMEAGSDRGAPENSNIRNTAFERICAIGAELVHYPAASAPDILAKIRLWRLLALEDALDPQRSSPDEQLLATIIDDIENHFSAA